MLNSNPRKKYKKIAKKLKQTNMMTRSTNGKWKKMHIFETFLFIQ